MSATDVLLIIVIPVVAVLLIVWGVYEARRLPSVEEQERANWDALGAAHDRERRERYWDALRAAQARARRERSEPNDL